MYDFLIIGGGVAGLSAGAALAELGSVLVLEAEDQLGYHASGRSAALFEENYGSVSTVALNRASRADHESAGVLSPRGLLMVGTQDSDDVFEADRDGMAMTEISTAEAAARIPILAPHITRAAIHEDALDIDTDKLLQSFVRRIRKAGGQIVTDARVTAIKGPGPWFVEASDTYEARQLVNAGGAWADHVAAMSGAAPLGLMPLRRSMGRIAAPGGHDVSSWPTLFGPGETWYAKPDAGALLVSPADEDPVEPHDAWADDMVLAEGFARYEAHVTEPVTRPIASWAGLRTFAPDRSLVIGPDPTVNDFWWSAGQGGYGMQSSHAAGRLLADLVGSRTSDLSADVRAALSPARFR